MRLVRQEPLVFCASTQGAVLRRIADWVGHLGTVVRCTQVDQIVVRRLVAERDGSLGWEAVVTWRCEEEP